MKRLVGLGARAVASLEQLAHLVCRVRRIPVATRGVGQGRGRPLDGLLPDGVGGAALAVAVEPRDDGLVMGGGEGGEGRKWGGGARRREERRVPTVW